MNFTPASWTQHERVSDTAGGGGRGSTYFVADSEHQFALRHYFRGGLVRHLFGDRYLWRGEGATRSFSEWHLLARIAAWGLPAPRPAAARYIRHGLTYTADLLTERLTGTAALSSRLAAAPLSAATWVEIGATLRRFHARGVCHADLNAHNILLRDNDTVFLLDFDRGSLRASGAWAQANLTRLQRSLEKIAASHAGFAYSSRDWDRLMHGYA